MRLGAVSMRLVLTAEQLDELQRSEFMQRKGPGPRPVPPKTKSDK